MEIYVLDRDINILGVFSTYEAIYWNPRFHEPGTFKASFLFSEKMNQILQRGNLIYKTDEVEPVIITRKFLKLSRNGLETIQVQGYMASKYLSRRIIWDSYVISGTYETIMRQLVIDQVIEPADPKRVIPGIELGELRGYEETAEKQVVQANLQDTLTGISKVAGLGYRLRLNIAAKKLLFEVYNGTDRTIGSEYPIVFSRDYGNVQEQDYSEDDTNYRNVCLVGGTHTGESRILTTAGAAAGLERYEMFYDAAALSNANISAEEYLLQLSQKGMEQLAKDPVAKSFESKVDRKKGEVELGDYVTCTDSKWGITLNAQIKQIEKGFSKTEESFVVTFGDAVPTLIDLIKAKE